MRGQPVPCRFCGAPDGDGHHFWECTCPPLVEICENPDFHDVMRMDRTHWPRCLLWHGWLPLISGSNGDSPWVDTAARGAVDILKQALGTYSSRYLFKWGLPDEFDNGIRHDDGVALVGDYPNVWTDGSLVLDEVSGASSSGSGFYAHLPGHDWRSRRWGGVLESCSFFSLCLVLFRMFRELSSGGVHLGVDNFGKLIGCWMVNIVAAHLSC